jgi:hypothetical protein
VRFYTRADAVTTRRPDEPHAASMQFPTAV